MRLKVFIAANFVLADRIQIVRVHGLSMLACLLACLIRFHGTYTNRASMAVSLCLRKLSLAVRMQTVIAGPCQHENTLDSQ